MCVCVCVCVCVCYGVEFYKYLSQLQVLLRHNIVQEHDKLQVEDKKKEKRLNLFLVIIVSKHITCSCHGDGGTWAVVMVMEACVQLSW